MKNKTTKTPVKLTDKQKDRAIIKDNKRKYQLEKNKRSGEVNIEYFNEMYPNITSTPREDYNVHIVTEIFKMFEEGKTDKQIISQKYGKRTKIELLRKEYNLQKKKEK